MLNDRAVKDYAVPVGEVDDDELVVQTLDNPAPCFVDPHAVAGLQSISHRP